MSNNAATLDGPQQPNLVFIMSDPVEGELFDPVAERALIQGQVGDTPFPGATALHDGWHDG